MFKGINNFHFKDIQILSEITKVFLVKILFHKFHYIPRIPPIVIIELTNHCNLSCIMCEQPLMNRKKITMEPKLAKKIVKECAELRVPRVALSRLGEPLLHPEVVDIIRFAKRCGIRTVSMISNGMLLNEDKGREIISAGLDLISFSVDAAKKETLERIRPSSNFNTIISNIEKFIEIRNSLSQKKPIVEIYTTLMRENTNEIPEIVERWKPLADRVKIWPVAPLTQTKSQVVFNTPQKGGKKACDILWTRLVVLSNGETSVCCSDTEGKLSVGNAHNSTIKDLWNSEKIRRIRSIHFRKRFHELPLCDRCFFINKAWCRTEKACIKKFEKEWELSPSKFLT